MPRGGYVHAATNFSACSTVLTIGQRMPSGPISKIGLMITGSFQGTRTIDAALVASIAVMWSKIVRLSKGACSPSIHTKSAPKKPKASAETWSVNPTAPPTTNSPFANRVRNCSALNMVTPSFDRKYKHIAGISARLIIPTNAAIFHMF